jgi:hypothetical protein
MAAEAGVRRLDDDVESFMVEMRLYRYPTIFGKFYVFAMNDWALLQEALYGVADGWFISL